MIVKRLAALAAASLLALALTGVASSAPALGATAVEIEAVAKSWVRIRGADGAVRVNRTLNAGDVVRLDLAPGLRLDTGNAAALILRIDGRAIPSLAEPGQSIVRRDLDLDHIAARVGDARAARDDASPVAPEMPAATAPDRDGPPRDPVAATPGAPAIDAPVRIRVPGTPQAVSATSLSPTSAAPPVSIALPVSETAQPPAAEVSTPAASPAPTPVAPQAAAPAPVDPPQARIAEPPPTPARPAADATGGRSRDGTGGAETVPVSKEVEAGPRIIAPALPGDVRPPASSPRAVQPAASTSARPAVATPTRLEEGAPIIRASDARLIDLEVGKGVLIRTDEAIDTVFVANPETADVQAKTAKVLYLFARAAGETSIYGVTASDKVVISGRIIVRPNVTALRESINATMPDARVNVATANNSIVLNGTVGSAQAAENLRRLAAQYVAQPSQVVNQLNVLSPNQVNLRVRVAEVAKSTLKEIGINTDVGLAYSEQAIGFFTGANLIGAGTNLFTDPVLVRRGPRSGGNANLNNIAGRFNEGNVRFDYLVDALATEGLVKILAEPNLTAVSGETANFLAGGEFPIPISEEDNRVSISYRQFGVSLAFTPTVLDSDRIALRVRPEVSELSEAGAIRIGSISVPSLTIRRAETSVELGSGQSFVIAGLLQQNIRQSINKFPWLGDLPILGALFRSDSYRRDETELVIVVTPYIVRPTSAKDVATPLDGLRPTNDIERLLFGQTDRAQTEPRPKAPLGRDGQRLIGPAGFVVE